MILQSLVQPFEKDVPLPMDAEGEVTEMATEPNNCTSETTGTSVRVKKFGVNNYRPRRPAL